MSKTSPCDNPVTLNKKGRLLLQPSPKTAPLLSSALEVTSDKAGEAILVIFFLITKTLQMYVFI